MKTKKLLIIVAVIAVCVLLLKSSPILGLRFYMVGSSSMEPEFPAYSLVLVKSGGFDDIKTGDVIAFNSQAYSGSPVLHRVTEKTENGLFTKGDANKHGDNQLIKNEDYIGKCIFKFTLFARYLRLIKNPAGALIFLILPLLLSAVLAVLIRQSQKQKKYEKQSTKIN